MPKCGSIGSYGQNQALWAHVWAENGPKTARIATGLARPDFNQGKALVLERRVCTAVCTHTCVRTYCTYDCEKIMHIGTASFR